MGEAILVLLVLAWVPPADHKRLLPLTEALSAACFSPDGSSVVTADKNNWLRVWTFPEKRQVFSVKGLFKEILELSFTADGDLVVSDETGVWTLDWRRLVAPRRVLAADWRIEEIIVDGIPNTVKTYTPIVKCVACPKRSFFCVTSWGKVIFVDGERAKNHVLCNPPSPIVGDGDSFFLDQALGGPVYFSDPSGVVHCFDAKTLRTTTVYAKEKVRLLRVFQNGKQFLVVNADKKELRIQDNEGKVLSSADLPGFFDLCVFATFKDESLTITDRNDVAYQFSLPDLKEQRRLPVPKGGLMSLSCHPTIPDLMIGGGERHELLIWDFRSDKKGR